MKPTGGGAPFDLVEFLQVKGSNTGNGFGGSTYFFYFHCPMGFDVFVVQNTWRYTSSSETSGPTNTRRISDWGLVQ